MEPVMDPSQETRVDALKVAPKMMNTASFTWLQQVG